uniref:Uncharacterized protein n=1 Tax=Heterorhabditis bacteriophora TaxID=37862 RepID=A0A1I7WPU3_HETBA
MFCFFHLKKYIPNILFIYSTIQTFDECLERNGRDCDMKQLWMQIPYFCGNHHFCS